MGHYGKLVKNENKDFLKEYIVNEKFMTSEEYEKLKSEGKLNLSFSDFYTLEYDPKKYLRLGDYEQFMRECFHCAKSNLFNKSTKINMLHITCRCTEYDDTLYLLNLKSQDKNIYSYCDNIYDYFENKNDYYRMM